VSESGSGWKAARSSSTGVHICCKWGKSKRWNLTQMEKRCRWNRLLLVSLSFPVSHTMSPMIVVRTHLQFASYSTWTLASSFAAFHYKAVLHSIRRSAYLILSNARMENYRRFKCDVHVFHDYCKQISQGINPLNRRIFAG